VVESEDWEQSGGKRRLGAKWWNAWVGSIVVERFTWARLGGHNPGVVYLWFTCGGLLVVYLWFTWFTCEVGSKVVARTGWEQSGGTHGLGAKWWKAKKVESEGWEQSGGTHGLGAKRWNARVGSKVVESEKS